MQPNASLQAKKCNVVSRAQVVDFKQIFLLRNMTRSIRAAAGERPAGLTLPPQMRGGDPTRWAGQLVAGQPPAACRSAH